MGVDPAEEMHSYIEALEEERRKILVFRRELPLCLELVTQAIGACKQQLAAAGVTECNNNGNGQSECSEQTSTEGTPVLEEFIPMKRPSGTEDDEDDEQHCQKQMKIDNNSNANDEKSSSADSKKKSDWLRSAQLWNQTPDPPPKEEHQPPRKVPVVEVKRNGGAFQPFHRDQKGSAKSHQSSEKPHSSPPTAATSSTTRTDSDDRREEKEAQAKTHTQTQRKQRRCWSPELHRRFLQALQQLGGSHAATPKQIRELMKVDGLTNDEVKSHLQKYRLHTRRPSPTVHSSSSSSQQPQIVVVGGIWVPPPEYTAAAATEATKATPANVIYAPVAAPPPPAAADPEVDSTKNPQSEGRCSHSSHSHSSPSSTSSSSHTITASPL